MKHKICKKYNFTFLVFFQILLCFGLTTAIFDHAEKLDSVLLAGRSRKEFRQVQDLVRQIEVAVLKKHHTDAEIDRIINDENSISYKVRYFGLCFIYIINAISCWMSHPIYLHPCLQCHMRLSALPKQVFCELAVQITSHQW